MIFEVHSGDIIPLGKSGENGAVTIVFDVERILSEFGDAGTFRLLNRRAGEDGEYPAGITRKGDKIHWTVGAMDNACPGRGECELQYYFGNTILKSESWDTRVLPAIGTRTEAPAFWATWEEQILSAQANAEGAEKKAQQAAQDAASAARDADAVRKMAAEGKLDGKPGYTPQKGIDYFDGEPGDKGEAFRYEDFTPEQLESLKVKGDPGYTPVKGVDYYTEAEKEEWKDVDLAPEVAAAKAEIVAKGAETLASIPADYTQLSDDLVDLENIVGNEILPNLPLEFTQTGYVLMTGYTSPSTSAQNTGFVEIGKYNQIAYAGNMGGSGASIAYFDSEQKPMLDAFIQGIPNRPLTVFDIPDGAKYLIASNYGTGSKTAILKTTSSTDTLTYRVRELEKKLFGRHYNTFSVIGDSYSSFDGYMADHNAASWYPASASGKDNNVNAVEDTWWVKFANSYGSRLIENNSWSGSTISYDGYQPGLDDGKAASFITRRKLLTTPELLIVFGGTNDAWVANGTGRTNEFLGSYKYSDFAESDFVYFRPSLAYLLDNLKKEHIGAKIVYILNDVSTIKESVKTICTHYDIPVLELVPFELSSAHPTIAGMSSIAEQLIKFLDEL